LASGNVQTNIGHPAGTWQFLGTSSGQLYLRIY
jgi:hypothetical protein